MAKDEEKKGKGKDKDAEAKAQPKAKPEAKAEDPRKVAARKAKEEAAAAEKGPTVIEKGPTPRLHEKYRKEIIPALMKQFGYTNAMAVPRLDKVVLNMGVGKATENERRVQSAAAELALIAGQKPLLTRAKKSVSAFRLRQGMLIGCKVTLRKNRMYEFMDRLISVAMPRIRDFRGVPTKSFDGRGNYTMGVSEQLIFAEIAADKVEFTQGMDITFCTTARSNGEAQALLVALGIPFRKQGEETVKDLTQDKPGAQQAKAKTDKAAKKA